MDLATFISDAAMMKAYAEWRSNPMTQFMLEQAKLLSAPLGLPRDSKTGEAALYYAGQVDASSSMYRFLANLTEFVEEQKALARMNQLRSNYGMEQILKAEGIDMPKVGEDVEKER